MNKKKQVKPEWFDGIVYQEGTTVRNPFSGEEYELNALELSIYDFVVGANLFLEKSFENGVEPDDKTEKITEDLHKGLDWFAKNNVEAYMALLD
tara:strand:- start:149 stop:430 length:282 start_codon:yes stop_codon:yes gene_type:complete